MNDYRAARQELQDQVLAAARKGQQRLATTVKNVTAAAQQIRPQPPNLPNPTPNISSPPRHAHRAGRTGNRRPHGQGAADHGKMQAAEAQDGGQVGSWFTSGEDADQGGAGAVHRYRWPRLTISLWVGNPD